MKMNSINGFKLFSLAAVVAFCFMVTTPQTQAQVNVEIGVQPSCPYGYYDVAPYSCAPYGYYGPEWFTGGVFIGAGQWVHRPANFRGHVDNSYHPEHGYKGALPARGEARAPEHATGAPAKFKGNESRDG